MGVADQSVERSEGRLGFTVDMADGNGIGIGIGDGTVNGTVYGIRYGKTTDLKERLAIQVLLKRMTENS